MRAKKRLTHPLKIKFSSRNNIFYKVSYFVYACCGTIKTYKNLQIKKQIKLRLIKQKKGFPGDYISGKILRDN